MGDVITGHRVLGTCPQVGLAVESDSDVLALARRAVAAASGQGFDEPHRVRVSRLATEMATSLVRRTRSARMFVQLVESGDHRGVELVTTDAPEDSDAHGRNPVGRPTFEELDAMARLSDVFDAYSGADGGTVMMARLWGGQRTTGHVCQFLVGSMLEAFPGEDWAGDAWAAEQSGGRIVALAADGLGHGEGAAAASAAAVETFRRHSDAAAEHIVGQIHQALRPTRGAAIGVVEIDRAAGRARFCGIGNITARLVVAGKHHELISHYGIAGYQARRIRAVEADWPDGALLVMHSDGLSARWDLDAYPRLDRCHPQLAAATLMRDAPRAHDDALVLALRGSDEARRTAGGGHADG